MQNRERLQLIGIVAWSLVTWPFEGIGARIEYWRWWRAHRRAGLVMRNGQSVRVRPAKTGAR